MRRTLLLLLVVSANINFAQITITAADFAHGGDTVRMSQAIDMGYDYSTTGTAQVWDFSGLTAISQTLKDFRPMAGAPGFVNFVFGTFAPLNYQANYYIESTNLPIDQVTQILPITITDIFQYTRFTAANDAVNSVGYSMAVDFGSGAQNIPFKSDTIETRYQLPLNYNNTYTSRGYTNIDFNPFYNAVWRQYRQRSSIVDGYGTLTTPLGTYDVLRIKHEIHESDSIYVELPFVGGTWLPLDLPLTREYEWWTNGQKEPLLKFTTNEVLGNEVVTTIEYRDMYLGLDAGIDEQHNDLAIFPNPVAETAFISSGLPFTHIEVFSTTGAKVIEQTFNSVNEVSVNTSALQPGIYSIRVEGDRFTVRKQLIKR